jgi:antitoxin HigA-1
VQNDISILKGLHPGIILERILKDSKLTKRALAHSIDEHPQTLGAITKGKRGMNTALALKIEEALGLDEGYFMFLQIYYEIREEKRKKSISRRPDLSKFRTVLFWDTQIEKIDWERQKRAVIERVFEKGNEQEKNEITRFYGDSAIKEILNTKTFR